MEPFVLKDIYISSDRECVQINYADLAWVFLFFKPHPDEDSYSCENLRQKHK